MKYIISILTVFLLQSACAFAEDSVTLKAEADSAFVHENYEKAVQLYSAIPGKENSIVICYNLGCSYYRLDEIAKSLLWFERAYLLNPGDEDVRVNLEMARSKTIDKIVPRHELIFVTAYRSLVNMMSLRMWAYTCIFCFGASLLCIVLFFFSERLLLRKAGFFAAVVFILFTIAGNVCAYQQRSFDMNRNMGIVMVSAVTVKSTPSESGNDLFVIHEGTRVEVTDNSLREWCEVRIADGKVGWIHKKCFELI